MSGLVHCAQASKAEGQHLVPGASSYPLRQLQYAHGHQTVTTTPDITQRQEDA